MYVRRLQIRAALFEVFGHRRPPRPGDDPAAGPGPQPAAAGTPQNPRDRHEIPLPAPAAARPSLPIPGD